MIAIIAILAAILFPVFARARENARRASCQSNLKQIGLGMIQYTQDYDGWSPGSANSNTSWPSLIFPYINADQVFVCPSADNTPTTMDFVTPATSYRGYTGNDGSQASLRKVNNGLSYSMNLIQTGGSATSGWTTPGFQGTVATPGANGPKSGFLNPGATASIGLNEAQIGDVAGTIRIFDAMSTDNSGTTIRAIPAEIRTDRYPNNTASKASQRHFEGFNVLFGDGHVKWRKYGTTTANEWSIQDDNPDGSLN